VQLKAGNLLLAAGQFDDAKVRAEKALAIAGKDVDAQILLANSLAGLRDFDAAIEEIEEAIQLEPNRASAYASLGAFEADRGRKEPAERAFLRAAELDGKRAPAFLALANFYWSERRLPDVEAALSRALTVEPDNVLAHRAMASYALQTNRPADAEDHLKRVYDLTGSPEAALALADFHASQKNEAAARALLEPLTTGPSAVQAAIRLAGLDHAAGRKPEAYKRIDQVLGAHPLNLHAHLVKTAMLLTDGRTDEALAGATQTTQSFPESTEGFFLLARAHVARREIDAAVRAYREVLRLNPRAVVAQLELSSLHLASGRPSESVGIAEDALRADPANADARLALARGLIVSGDLVKAEREVSKLAAEFPQSPAVQLQRGALFTRKRDLAGARRAFELAIQIDPSSLDALSGLVGLDLADRKPEAARARVERLVTETPASSAGLMLAARTYVATGDLKTGESLLRRLLRQDPGHLPAYGALGGIYVQQGRLDAALAEFEAAAVRDAKPVAALTLAGIILEAQNRTDEARARYERVVQIEPSAPVAANNLAWLYAESGSNLDQALQLARRAHEKLPDLPEVGDTLGFVYYKKDLVPQAIQVLKATVEKDPANSVYRYHLALALAKAGERATAVEHLTRALDLDKDFDGASHAQSLLAELAQP
jgi:tetratricopeptide (TPR) repeat protein